MEVIGKDGVSEDIDAAKVGDLPNLTAEGVLGVIVEEKSPVHCAGHNVINGDTRVGGDLDARVSHERKWCGIQTDIKTVVVRLT